jgi:hypothetical protein
MASPRKILPSKPKFKNQNQFWYGMVYVGMHLILINVVWFLISNITFGSIDFHKEFRVDLG